MRSSIIGAKRRYFDLICRIAETLRIVLGSFSCPSITCISYCDASAECGLELHPTKTKIVYCKDDDRRGHYPNEKFDYLGYTFRARRSKNRWGKFFVNFSPGVSNVASKAIRQAIRDWQLGCRVDRWIDDLARMFNPVIRGWITYYGRY